MYAEVQLSFVRILRKKYYGIFSVKNVDVFTVIVHKAPCHKSKLAVLLFLALQIHQ